MTERNSENMNSPYVVLDPLKVKRLLDQKCLGPEEWYLAAGVNPRTGRRVQARLPIRKSSARDLLNALDVSQYEAYYLTGAASEKEESALRGVGRQIQEWTVFDVPTPVCTASNGLQYRTYPLKHNYLDRYAWGKCYELCHLPDAEREDYQAYLLRHPEVCERLKQSAYFPRVETTCPDPNGQDWWVLDEWSEGEYLSERLEQEELSFSETVNVLQQTAHALHVLHQQQIILRELSPVRLWLLKDSSQIQLVDLELAKLLDGNPSVSNDGWFVDPYRAPEVDSGRCNERADLFSWGQLAIRLFTGQISEPGTVPQLSVELPLSSSQIALIQQCILISPSRRPKSVTEIFKVFDDQSQGKQDG